MAHQTGCYILGSSAASWVAFGASQPPSEGHKGMRTLPYSCLQNSPPWVAPAVEAAQFALEREQEAVLHRAQVIFLELQIAKDL